MQHTDALLLCSQTRAAAAADPFTLILQHSSIKGDAQLACKLLRVSQGLRSSVQQLLRGQLQLIVEPPKATAPTGEEDDSYYDEEEDESADQARTKHKFAGDACKITPWLAKHAALLKGLQLDIERIRAPVTKEFAAAPAPPGRACCGCCDCCKHCSWDTNPHAGNPYAGECMDPLQEQAIAAALQLAASTGDLVLREFSCSPASNAILQQLPTATLTSLSLTWFDEDETTHDIPATAAALAGLTALKAADFRCNSTDSWGFEPVCLGGISSALSALTSLTSISMQRAASRSLQHLPSQLMQLTLVFHGSPMGDLDLLHLSALQRLDLGIHVPEALWSDSDDDFVPYRKCDPVLMGGERLPVSLRQLNIDNCSSKGLASLLRLQSLQALSIRTNVCTVGAPDLAQLSRLPNLSSLQLGFTASAFSAGAALALTQFTALTHLSLGVPPEGSWVNARVSSKRTWPAAPVPFQCISRLTSLSSLSVWCINAAPQELAAAIAPLTALTRLLLHPESAWFFVEEEGHRRAARSAEDIAEDKRGIAVLVGVLAGLPKLRALKVNFWWRLTWDQEQQLERMLRRGYRMQYY